jgi:hypothetical protein
MCRQPNGDDVMKAFKKLVQSILGTDKTLDEIETKLKEELSVARGKTRDALESLQLMAQEMQWRVEELEKKDKRRDDEEHGRK